MQYELQASAKSSIFFNIIFYRKDASDSNTLNAIDIEYPIAVKDIVDSSTEDHTFFRTFSDKNLQTFLLVDLGQHTGFGQLQPYLSNILSGYKKSFPNSIQVDFRLVKDPDLIYNFTLTFELLMYAMANYKTGAQKPEEKSPISFYIVDTPITVPAQKQLTEATTIALHQKSIMDLVNGPGNRVNPPFLVNWIKEKSITCKFSTKIFDKERMQALGLHATLAVNQGSEWDPAFIIMEYEPADNATVKTIGLVGKGITFDTGGLSIKTGPNMHYMKSDMGGAAAVFGTMATVAELQWPIHLIGIVPVTDNGIDANAMRPGDVISSYGGTTIEVINTDAEGRLVLADGLAYMTKHFNTDHIIDLATLTGSCVRTFGSVCAGLFSNDDKLAEKLITSGNATGEKLWPLPMWDEYSDELKSDIADIKNLATKPVAGAITAAKFLETFIDGHPSWAHLDIAGVAFGDTKYAKGKAATGFGVHLLTHFIKSYFSD